MCMCVCVCVSFMSSTYKGQEASNPNPNQVTRGGRARVPWRTFALSMTLMATLFGISACLLAVRGRARVIPHLRRGEVGVQDLSLGGGSRPACWLRRGG